MHNIHMAEFSEEFAHCWNAAGSHIQRMAGGELMSWLKATLPRHSSSTSHLGLEINCFSFESMMKTVCLRCQAVPMGLWLLQRVATAIHA
jgi:hypothetical protein